MNRDVAALVVVGAGPVGLVLAIAFAAAGVPVVVLESDAPGVRAEWRGSTLHPPTLEHLNRIGLASAVISHGVRVDRLQYRDLESDAVASFDYAALRGQVRFPFRIQFEQYKLLRLLREAAAGSPAIDIRYGEQVVALTQIADSATLTTQSRDGSRFILRTRWVVAADGAHSTMRKLSGIAFPGSTYPTLSLVAATRFPFEDVVAGLGPVSYWSGPAGRASLIHTPDAWRIAVSTGEDALTETPAPGADRDSLPHPALADAMDRLVGGRGWRARPLLQHQLYRSHQRVAAAFHGGRVVLAGDAAHLTSTTGGMGLNSGIHDAFELAARLGQPLAERDDDGERTAVTSYARVRRQVAIDVVQPATRSARTAVDTSERGARLARLAALQREAADRPGCVRHLRQVSMLDAVRAESVAAAASSAEEVLS